MDYRGQLATFFIMVLTGMVLGGMFDLFRILRGLFRLRRGWSALADLLYWLLAAGVVFGALVLGNWGELRLYVFLGLAAGVAAYYRLLSRWVVRLLVGLIKVTGKGIALIRLTLYYSLVKPAGVLGRLIIAPAIYLRRKFARPPQDNIPPQ